MDVSGQKLRGFLLRCIASITVLFATSCLLAATGFGQELASVDSRSAAPGSTSGWWSPEHVAPHLQLSLADLKRFEPPSQVLRSNRVTTAQIMNFLADSESLSPQSEQSADLSALAQSRALPLSSLLGQLHTKYATWQTGLSDTRTPVDLNGLSVYPLVQIRYGQWTVPVSLYISPLRDGDNWR